MKEFKDFFVKFPDGIDGDEKYAINVANIENMFTHQNQFRIPSYQRPYSWTTKEVKELIDDIEKTLNESKKWFCGTIFTSQDNFQDNIHYDHNTITEGGKNKFYKVDYYESPERSIKNGKSLGTSLRDFNLKNPVFSKDISIFDIIQVFGIFVNKQKELYLSNQNERHEKWIPIEFHKNTMCINCSTFMKIINEYSKKPTIETSTSTTKYDKKYKTESKVDRSRGYQYYDTSVFSDKQKRSIKQHSSKYVRGYELEMDRHESNPDWKLKRNDDEFTFTGEISKFERPKIVKGKMTGGFGKIKLNVGDKYFHAYFHISSVLNKLQKNRPGHVHEGDKIKCHLN